MSMCIPTHALSINGIWKVQRSRETSRTITHNPSTREPVTHLTKGIETQLTGNKVWLHHTYSHGRLRLCTEEPFLHKERSWLHLLTHRCYYPKTSPTACHGSEKRCVLGINLAFLTLAPFATDHFYLDKNVLCLH